MSEPEDEGDELERAYWKYINPRMTDVDASLPCPRCGSTNVDHSRGYRAEYTCKKCGKKWRRR